MEEIAGYTVDTRSLLGRGGFGEVFVALDKSTQRVAAKRVWLKTTSLSDILAEVSTLKNVKPHKYILGFLASERTKDFLWIFTEYCEEGDLSQYCTTHELNFTHKLDISHQCACAVAHLHGLKPTVVHRDIKPTNILMTHTSKDTIEIKLADFGLAKTAGGGHMRTLAMRTICGTEAFMAPEHFFMERRVACTYGRSVDLFALGLVFAGLLDAIPGKPLLPITVRGLALGQVMYRMQEQSLPVWSPVAVDVDDHPLILHLKALISAMISAHPESRPTAEKTEKKLQFLLESAPLTNELPRNLTQNGNANGHTEEQENYFYRELTTVKEESDHQTVVRKSAVRRRREFKSRTRGHNLRATMDLGSQMRLRGPEHKFVMVGGSTGYNASDVCWELDTPDDGFFWKCFDEVPSTMRQQFGYSVCAIDDKSFAIAGGSRGNTDRCQNACFIYSVKTMNWEKLPNAGTPRTSAGMACYNKVLYFIGGEGNRKAILKACEKLDLKAAVNSRKWYRCPEMLLAMVFPLTAAAGNSVYVVSNTHMDNSFKKGAVQLQCMDTRREKWMFKCPLPVSVKDTAGASLIGDGGHLYLIAGWEKLCARYNVEVDAWTLLQPCLKVHSFAAVCCAGGKINVFGGQDETGPTTVIEEYDIDRNEWRVRTLEMPEPIVYHHALVLHMQPR